MFNFGHVSIANKQQKMFIRAQLISVFEFGLVVHSAIDCKTYILRDWPHANMLGTLAHSNWHMTMCRCTVNTHSDLILSAFSDWENDQMQRVSFFFIFTKDKCIITIAEIYWILIKECKSIGIQIHRRNYGTSENSNSQFMLHQTTNGRMATSFPSCNDRDIGGLM